MPLCFQGPGPPSAAALQLKQQIYLAAKSKPNVLVPRTGGEDRRSGPLSPVLPVCCAQLQTAARCHTMLTSCSMCLQHAGSAATKHLPPLVGTLGVATARPGSPGAKWPTGQVRTMHSSSCSSRRLSLNCLSCAVCRRPWPMTHPAHPGSTSARWCTKQA